MLGIPVKARLLKVGDVDVSKMDVNSVQKELETQKRPVIVSMAPPGVELALAFAPAVVTTPRNNRISPAPAGDHVEA